MMSDGVSWRPSIPLAPAEEALLERAAAGEVFGLAGTATGPDPDRPGTESAPRIRAAVLRHLLTQADWPVDAKGVQLFGAVISEHLDLEAAVLRCPLRLEECTFSDPRPVSLSFATAPLIAFSRCRLSGVLGESLQITANLEIRESTITGPVVLSGMAVIKQNLYLAL